MRSVLALFFFIVSLVSCNSGPEPIKTGIDFCYFCKMTISDARFGAELVTRKGKIYKFDDSRCVLDFLKTNELRTGEIKNIYFSDFCGLHELINVKEALFLQSDKLRGPMGGNIAAFKVPDSLRKIQVQINGINISWAEINKQ